MLKGGPDFAWLIRCGIKVHTKEEMKKKKSHQIKLWDVLPLISLTTN